MSFLYKNYKEKYKPSYLLEELEPWEIVSWQNCKKFYLTASFSWLKITHKLPIFFSSGFYHKSQHKTSYFSKFYKQLAYLTYLR